MAQPAVMGDAPAYTIPLSGNLRGSALAFRQGARWLVAYVKAGEGAGRVWKVPEQKILALIAKGIGALDPSAAERELRIAALDPSAAERELRIADQTQGAAVAGDGSLWLTQSGGRFGRLQQIDTETGRVMTSYSIPAGIEDIEFGPDGQTWAVSETGSQRWNAWPTFFPLAFSLDLKSLR